MKMKLYKNDKKSAPKSSLGDLGVYHFLYGITFLHALLPFCVLYILSDILSFLMYHIIRYRRRLVRKNLILSFPEKSKKEIIRIEKDFYRNFCDCIVETIKVLHISKEEIRKRMNFTNIEILRPYFEKGDSFVMTLGHYGNWEWVSSLALWLPKDMLIGQIYRELKNKPFDKLMYNLRARFDADNIEKKEVLRTIIKSIRAGKKFIIGFIADQKPSPNNMHYWTTFLNQETSVLTGPERIANQSNAVVFYMDVKKIKRGYYEAEIIIISDNPKAEKENEITEKYIRLMENTIMRNPALWLWSHNRWKHKRSTIENQ
jgi:KDO2-lipid IV(A) lauroyltransferase